MKRIGITADNYKVAMFKEELTKAGFPSFTVSSFTQNTSLIKVSVEDSQVDEVRKVCKLIELHFKHSN